MRGFTAVMLMAGTKIGTLHSRCRRLLHTEEMLDSCLFLLFLVYYAQQHKWKQKYYLLGVWSKQVSIWGNLGLHCTLKPESVQVLKLSLVRPWLWVIYQIFIWITVGTACLSDYIASWSWLTARAVPHQQSDPPDLRLLACFWWSLSVFLQYYSVITWALISNDFEVFGGLRIVLLIVQLSGGAFCFTEGRRSNVQALRVGAVVIYWSNRWLALPTRLRPLWASIFSQPALFEAEDGGWSAAHHLSVLRLQLFLVIISILFCLSSGMAARAFLQYRPQIARRALVSMSGFRRQQMNRAPTLHEIFLNFFCIDHRLYLFPVQRNRSSPPTILPLPLLGLLSFQYRIM